MNETITGFIAIDGVDITPYIKEGGFSWQRYDVDSSESQRLMDGNLVRNKITTKYKLNVICKPLNRTDARTVLGAIKSQSFPVRYLDPEEGGYVTRTCHASDIPAHVLTFAESGEAYWMGIEFSLIEY